MNLQSASKRRQISIVDILTLLIADQKHLDTEEMRMSMHFVVVRRARSRAARLNPAQNRHFDQDNANPCRMRDPRGETE